MAKLSKKELKALSQRLTLEKKPVWERATAAQRKEILALGERYKAFLDAAKTERLAVKTIVAAAEAAGFKPLGQGKAGKGARLYSVYQDKVVALALLGQAPPSRGLRILGAHTDCPRLDFKMHPLYESAEMAFLKTHYYGGVKKYQWLARPLALHGVICTKDGRAVEVHLGEDPGDPVFSLLDLLPHLSRKTQGTKKVADAFEAEKMNLLVGVTPLDGEGKDKVKLAVLQLLDQAYGINEADLISAELQAVPAGPARDVGLDRALVGGYGQDDRAACFAILEAALKVKKPAAACLALFVDKEEIGSEGSTSAQSRFLELVTADILEAAGETASFATVARTLARSQAISADVNAAFDPDFAEVHDKSNAAFLGYGVNLTKYTGSGGKYSASDANAEYMAWIRKVWDEAGVVWQAAGMGKIDEGGGGTIAKVLANYGMEVVDAGPALLNMHSPFELGAKSDIHSTCQAFHAFLAAPARG